MSLNSAQLSNTFAVPGDREQCRFRLRLIGNSSCEDVRLLPADKRLSVSPLSNWVDEVIDGQSAVFHVQTLEYSLSVPDLVFDETFRSTLSIATEGTVENFPVLIKGVSALKVLRRIQHMTLESFRVHGAEFAVSAKEGGRQALIAGKMVAKSPELQIEELRSHGNERRFRCKPGTQFELTQSKQVVPIRFVYGEDSVLHCSLVISRE